MTLEDYRSDVEMCCRCSACKFIPLEKVRGYPNLNVCPSIARHNFHLRKLQRRSPIMTPVTSAGWESHIYTGKGNKFPGTYVYLTHRKHSGRARMAFMNRRRMS